MYVDEICSEESKKIVEDHLSQCSICKEIYDSMCNLKQEDIHDYHESQRIKSLKQVKKKILYKQILIGLSSIVLLFVLGFGIMTGLKNEIEIVNPDNCVSVSMINGSLTTRLQGSRIYEATIKRVSISSKDYLFFFVKNSQWDALTTNEEIYSELILCPEDKNADEIVESIFKYLPQGPQYYDEDTVTDQPMRQIVAEIIREKALHALNEEIPHGIAVTIEKMKERKNGKITDIEATIICERDSHKGIIIGKQGSMLKKIGSNARYEIEQMLEMKVNLQLWVKVRKEWRDSDLLLKNYGYNEKQQ